MKSLLPLLLVSLVGAGCMPAPGGSPAPDIQNTGYVEDTSFVTSATCPTMLTEDESGAMRVTLLETYATLPHLGQVYTALDCNHPEWVDRIHGMKDGSYTLGVHLFVTETQMTAERRNLLTSLGFTENENGTWQTEKPLSQTQLLQLKPLLLEVQAPFNTQLEDCILCG